MFLDVDAWQNQKCLYVAWYNLVYRYLHETVLDCRMTKKLSRIVSRFIDLFLPHTTHTHARAHTPFRHELKPDGNRKRCVRRLDSGLWYIHLNLFQITSSTWYRRSRASNLFIFYARSFVFIFHLSSSLSLSFLLMPLLISFGTEISLSEWTNLIIP